MHSNRRRKKRSNNGVKVVNLCRGRNGFGFTISGQFPCKLSCVVKGSPADEVGLKPGDYLIAVNGMNVVKTLHDEVVHLIGCSEGALHLQISDSYCSDTSDEDCPPAARIRPRYPGHKVRHRFKNASLGQLPSTLSRNFPGDIEFDAFHDPSILTSGRLQRNPQAVSESVLHPSRRSPRKRDRIISASRGRLSVDVDSARDHDLEYSARGACASPGTLLKTIVGYLGTIGMPKDTHMIPSSRLQAVRNCIRRLRVEKKVHTLVLFSVFPDRITLQNPHGMILASYPSDRVTFCGAYADDNKFFGIVTRSSSSANDVDRGDGSTTPPRRNASSSCHVFMVDAKMHFHADHAKRARAFRIECTGVDPNNDGYQCSEFPSSAGPILQSIVKYWGRSFQGSDTVTAPGLVNADSPSSHPPVEPNPNASPQPSLTSTNSSNSDSGIGFRDDAISCAEREGVLDYSGCHYLGAEAFPVEFDSAHVESFSGGSVDRRSVLRGASESSLAERLCVRAMPNSSSSSLLETVKSPSVDHRLSAQVFNSSSEPSKRLNLNCTRSLDDIRDQGSDTSRTCSGDIHCTTYPFEAPPPSRFGPCVNFRGSESNLSIRCRGKKETNVDDLLAAPWSRPYPGTSAIPAEKMSEYSRADESTTHASRASDDEEGISRRTEAAASSHRSQHQSFARSSSLCAPDDGSDRDERLWASLSDGLAHLDSQGFLRPLPPAEYALQQQQQQQQQKHQAGSRGGGGRPPPAPASSSSSASGVTAVSTTYGSVSLGGVAEASSSFSAADGDRRRTRAESGGSVPQPPIDHRRVHSDTVALQLSQMVADLSRTGEATCASLETTSSAPGAAGGSNNTMASSAGAANQSQVAVGRVDSWSHSFEALLRDTAGIHTFAEFLKKEFSHENIYFWVAVQRYKLMFEKANESEGEGNVTDKEKEERISAAREIYERHLSLSAAEPVNVDSHARQFVEENIARADAKIFVKAEQQIFNLMKYDSYARFLKCSLYKDALRADNEGKDLPYPGGDHLETDLRLDSGGQADGDSRNESANQKQVGRRRSLLGWGKRSRAKSRESRPRSRTRAPRASSLRRLRPKDSKAVENVDAASQKSGAQNVISVRDGSVHSNSSRVSMVNSDLALMSRNFSTSQESLQSEKECTPNASCMSVSSNGKDNYSGPLCRMILPDQSTTVVPLTPGESIRSLITRLLDKKGLKYSATDVYTINSNVPIDQTKDSLVLSCQEVRVERRVLIRLVLPWEKHLAIKAGPGRKLCEVLRPILASHNLELQRITQVQAATNRPGAASAAARSAAVVLPSLKVDQFTAHRAGEEASLSMKTLATNLDNETVVLKYKEGASGHLGGRGFLGAAGAKKLDEITNRVFMDLMRSKSVTDADKVPTDESSSQSSGIVGSLVRRNSIHVDRDISAKALTPTQAAVPHADAAAAAAASQENLLKSVLSPPRLFLDDPGDQPSPSREELYVELKRADRLRLDDQRGTKLNCEIPEFLRPAPSSVSSAVDDKENDSKNQPVRMDESDFMRHSSTSAFSSSRPVDESGDSSLYGDHLNVLEVSYGQFPARTGGGLLSSSRLMPSESSGGAERAFQAYAVGGGAAARKITGRRTAIGLGGGEGHYAQSNAVPGGGGGGGQHVYHRLLPHGSQASPPPPLPPKPKIFRAPPSLRPPPPPPPPLPPFVRRDGGGGGSSEAGDFGRDDYLAPPRPRAVRRSERLAPAGHGFDGRSSTSKPLPNISFV